MLKFLWIDWFCILELWLGQHYQPYNVVDLAICVQCTHDTADRLERGTRQARWTTASCSRAGNSWTAWWEVEIKQLNFFGIWKYFAAVLINRTMQVLKIYLFLAALGIPFQPLPDYEEGADQVLFFYVHFGWKVLVSNIWRIFTCRYWDTNPQCFFFFYICLIFQALLTAKHYMEKSNAPYAFLVKRQTFAPYKLKKGPEPEEYVYLF